MRSLSPYYAGRTPGGPRILSDWPPERPTGPEPGSYDMPPEPGPLNELSGFLPELSNMEKTLALGAAGLAAYWFWFRKKRGRR